HPQPYPVGGGHDDQHAEDDGEDRNDHGIAERRLEAGIAQHDPVGIKGIDAATHTQRELERADQRNEEIGGAKPKHDPGPEFPGFHLSHLSDRVRNQMYSTLARPVMKIMPKAMA